MPLLAHNDTDDTRRSLSSSKEAKRLTLPHPHSCAVWMTKALVRKKNTLTQAYTQHFPFDLESTESVNNSVTASSCNCRD